MGCPYCSVNFHDQWYEQVFAGGYGHYLAEMALVGEPNWWYRNTVCSGCRGVIIEIGIKDDYGDVIWNRVHPVGTNRGPVPKEVPVPVANDYIEACNVLDVSPKASAALSRRCLQAMLHAHGYKRNSLAQEVDDLLNESGPRKSLPSRLHTTVDGIRNFGNFSAHPTNDKASLEIIDVEPHEAEWCLEILEDLFEHFYVGPAAAKAKKAALDAKLLAAGKPVSK